MLCINHVPYDVLLTVQNKLSFLHTELITSFCGQSCFIAENNNNKHGEFTQTTQSTVFLFFLKKSQYKSVIKIIKILQKRFCTKVIHNKLKQSLWSAV